MRPFRPKKLDRYAGAELHPRFQSGETVNRFTITVPLQEILPTNQVKLNVREQKKLEDMLTRHFRGCTAPPPTAGYGLRDPDDPEAEPEMNWNASYVVLTSLHFKADDYFRALRKELEEALDEGVILIEKQTVTIV